MRRLLFAGLLAMAAGLSAHAQQDFPNKLIRIIVPFTPGGAGVAQALLVKVFGGSATVATYSVGQQIAIAAWTFAIGLTAVVFIFRFRSFKEVIAAGRAERDSKPAEPEPA